MTVVGHARERICRGALPGVGRHSPPVTDVAEQWAAPGGWVVLARRRPASRAGPDAFRSLLDAAGLEGVDVRVELQPEYRVELPGA